MFALIKDNIVVQITNETFEVHPSLVFIDCDNSVEVGDTYNPFTQQFVKPVSPIETLDQVKKRYEQEMQYVVDSQAQSKGYKDGFSCAGYFNSTNLQWKAEAETFVAWRDGVYEYAYQVLDSSTPESYPTLEQFLADAPTIVWP